MASDTFAEAYVVPLDKILLDIKQSLGAVSIGLPSRRDIFNWRLTHVPSDSVPALDSGYESLNSSPRNYDQKGSLRPSTSEQIFSRTRVSSTSTRPDNLTIRTLGLRHRLRSILRKVFFKPKLESKS